jgi:uncharacterized integral membrane protein
MLLNLVGIACLALGIGSVFAWHHPRHVPSHPALATAARGSEDAAVVVRMVVGADGQVTYPVSADSRPQARRGTAEMAADEQVSAEAEPPDAAAVHSAAVHSAADRETTALLERIELEGLEAGAGAAGAESVDPVIARVEIDYEARPDWVDQPDREEGDRHLICVTSGPFTTLRQARRELQKELKVKTDEYLREFLEHPQAARWVGYDAQEIQLRFVAPDRIFDEKVRSPSFGYMYQCHALLEFGPAFHSEAEQAWHDVLARAQLVKVALAGGAVLGMLVLLFGYFNADTATRGFYSGRLKFLTALAILAVIAAGFFIARSIPWLSL